LTPRTGRRPGESGAREAILDAARAEFAANGYDRATIRAIARGAEVDPALVHHYFGSKEELFVAAIDAPLNPAEVIRSVLAENLEDAGERLVRLFLTIWEESANRDVLMSVLRGALTNERAAKALREFVEQAILGGLEHLLPGPDAALRGSLIGSHMMGLALFRYGVKVEPLASSSVDEVVALVGPRIQSYLTSSKRVDPVSPPTATRTRWSAH
jgi:AcrR family transcriptional regulator